MVVGTATRGTRIRPPHRDRSMEIEPDVPAVHPPEDSRGTTATPEPPPVTDPSRVRVERVPLPGAEPRATEAAPGAATGGDHSQTLVAAASAAEAWAAADCAEHHDLGGCADARATLPAEAIGWGVRQRAVDQVLTYQPIAAARARLWRARREPAGATAIGAADAGGAT
jgi:hypothetical protein